MAKIGLTEGFSLIPEGSHVFQITEVKYKEDFGKMEVTMQTATGQKHTERFSLLDKDGELDLDGLMTEVFLLEMDTKNLCSEDCRGLCPGCGVDLNHEPCRCKKEIDPRLAKLAQLLEKQEDQA